MQKTYIFGHKKPDSDSVMSAIGLSYLKNSLGENTEPRILGDINKETKYALKYFNIKTPEYLNDVKLQLKDIDYHKNFFIKETDSIYTGYQRMSEKSLTGIPIVDDKNYFKGLITIKDLSHVIINENTDDLYTSYANLLNVLKASEVLKFDDEIIGRILVAAYRSTTFMETVKLDSDMILIVGDRHSIIEYAVRSKVKLLILSGDARIKDEHLEIARQNKVNIIRTPYTTYHITKLVTLANYIKTMLRCLTPIKFEVTDFVDNVTDINNKLKHTNYPIVDRRNKCLGLLKITDLSEKHPKKVILVDHNEKLQSVEGLEEAEILEIIDHHNIGTVGTNMPISFRNMPVGSTNTIIYKLYKENRVTIPKAMAGLMLSGILSDTLILTSPTTTDEDVVAVKDLSKIAKIDYKDYGYKMIKAGSSLKGMTREQVLYKDYKNYVINGNKIGLGQIVTTDINEILNDKSEYINLLNNISEKNNYLFVCLFITNILENGTYVLYSDRAKDILSSAFDIENISEGQFLNGIVSRKKQILPELMNDME